MDFKDVVNGRRAVNFFDTNMEITIRFWRDLVGHSPLKSNGGFIQGRG
jgi:hypothetical protein